MPPFIEPPVETLDRPPSPLPPHEPYSAHWTEALHERQDDVVDVDALPSPEKTTIVVDLIDDDDEPAPIVDLIGDIPTSPKSLGRKRDLKPSASTENGPRPSPKRAHRETLPANRSRESAPGQDRATNGEAGLLQTRAVEADTVVQLSAKKQCASNPAGEVQSSPTRSIQPLRESSSVPAPVRADSGTVNEGQPQPATLNSSEGQKVVEGAEDVHQPLGSLPVSVDADANKEDRSTPAAGEKETQLDGAVDGETRHKATFARVVSADPRAVSKDTDKLDELQGTNEIDGTKVDVEVAQVRRQGEATYEKIAGPGTEAAPLESSGNRKLSSKDQSPSAVGKQIVADVQLRIEVTNIETPAPVDGDTDARDVARDGGRDIALPSTFACADATSPDMSSFPTQESENRKSTPARGLPKRTKDDPRATSRHTEAISMDGKASAAARAASTEANVDTLGTDVGCSKAAERVHRADDRATSSETTPAKQPTVDISKQSQPGGSPNDDGGTDKRELSTNGNTGPSTNSTSVAVENELAKEAPQGPPPDLLRGIDPSLHEGFTRGWLAAHSATLRGD